jgi:hypothetical protein
MILFLFPIQQMKKLVYTIMICGMPLGVLAQTPASEQPASKDKVETTTEKDKKTIKSVPSTSKKGKPSKISSAARPQSLKPSQAKPSGKPTPSKKPPVTGRPAGN